MQDTTHKTATAHACEQPASLRQRKTCPFAATGNCSIYPNYCYHLDSYLRFIHKRCSPIYLEDPASGRLRNIRNVPANPSGYHGPSFTGETMKKMLKLALIAAAAAAAFGASAQEFPAK
ncbi:MAG: hypothetical protein EOO29_48250, partial [Comamonadaceae bacterium]